MISFPHSTNLAMFLQKIANKMQSFLGSGQTRLVVDHSHNFWTQESHHINGRDIDVNVMRKGTNRAISAGQDEVKGTFYEEVGYPLVIPGDSVRGSYVVIPTEKVNHLSLRSLAHGAGRLVARIDSHDSMVQNDKLVEQLKEHSIVLKTRNRKTYAEEAPQNYKDIEEVVPILEKLGLVKVVCHIKPMIVIKT